MSVEILGYTTKNPLSLMGEMAGKCWNSPTDNAEKNIKRAKECISNMHGRVLEFPDIYMILDEYSAKVIREWYTHIGGLPTRLQESTRYVEYDNFKYVSPPKFKNDQRLLNVYQEIMEQIAVGYAKLLDLGATKEDASMVLPFGMETKIVDKRNLRNLIEMSRQRMCTRAFWEYRKLYKEICDKLKAYSAEWEWIVDTQMMPKCEMLGYCPEKFSCGRKPQKGKEDVKV